MAEELQSPLPWSSDTSRFAATSNGDDHPPSRSPKKQKWSSISKNFAPCVQEIDKKINGASVERLEQKDGVCVEEVRSFCKFEEFGASSGKQLVEFETEKSNVDVVKKGNELSETLLNLNCNHELIESGPEKRLNCDALTCSLKADSMNVTTGGDTLKTGEKMYIRWDGKIDSELVADAAGASNGRLRKFAYSRKEMEALMLVNVKAQNFFWQEMRKGLNKTIKNEYDELGNFKHQKHVNRRPNAEIRSYDGQGFQGETSAADIKCDTEPVISMKFSCDGDNKRKDSNDLMQEWSEQEESDDECESIQRPAFLVKGEPDFESGPPEDGLEYLRRVRWEASHIPKVKVVKIDNRKLKKEQSGYMPKIPDIEKCPPHLLPSKQWEDEFIADFSKLRLALSHLEDTNDATSTNPHMIIFGPREHKSLSSKDRASLELPTSGPTLSTITAMEPAARVAMLKRCTNFFESTNNLSKNECAWLFALCAAVDTPLDADTFASLRCLLRRCAKLRAGKSELDDEVVMLNVLATISGKFFGQSEN